MIAWAVRQLVLWGIVAGVIFTLVHRLAIPHGGAVAEPPRFVAAAPGESGRTAGNSLIFHANGQGHVFLDAFVNGARVRFLVDTGATYVALAPQDAAAAGIPMSDLTFNVATRTANGVAKAAMVRLREVRIDQLSVPNVDAVVHENLPMSLLGQSFLTRIGGYEMRDGMLTLNWR